MSAFRPRHAAFAVAALCAGGLALYLTVLRPSADGPPDPAVEAAATARHSLDALPEPLRDRPDAVTGAVRLAAERLPADPSAVVAAVLAAVDAGHLPPRDPLADAADAPRTAGALAPALSGTPIGPSASFERATLAVALFRARGLDDGAYGVAPGAPGSATELVARRYVVRAGDGPWLPLDRQPLDPATVTPLDEVGFMANVLAWRALGAMVSGDGALASQAAQHARRLAPDDAAILATLGKTQLFAGLTDAGVASLERAATLQADALTWLVLARTARLQDKPARAEEHLRKAIAADPAFIPAHLLRAELAIDRLDVTPTAERPAVIAMARDAIAAARKVDPNAAGLRVLEANLAALEDHPEQAEALLREEARLHPDKEDAWLLLAQVLTVHERDADALRVLEEAIGHGLVTPEILKGHGALLASNGRWDQALQSFELALQKAPDDPDLRPQVAQLYRARDREDEARALLVDHITRFPDDVTALLLLAQLELDNARFDAAQVRLDRARELAPDNADLALLDYVAQLLSGRDAARTRARALELVGSRREVAQTLLEQAQVGEAEKLLLEALDTDADDAAVPILLVGIYYGTGRNAEADKLRARTLEHFAPEDHAELNRLFEAAIEQALSQRAKHDAPPPAPTTPDGAGQGTPPPTPEAP